MLRRDTPPFVSAVVGTLLAALLNSAREARAQDRDAPAQDELHLMRDGTSRTPSPPPRWAVGFNPLAIAIGRHSVDVERLVVPGFAILVNVHGDFASHDLPAIEYDRVSPLWGFGGEAGFRWFTAERGMRGFFVGATLVGGWYSVEYYGRRIGLPGVGVALDMGGQFPLGRSLFLAFGGGMQHLWTSRYPADIAPGVSFVMGAGFDTRILLTFGMLLP
jgi:hypothetical protein